MHKNHPLSIRLMVDRQERIIMTDTILYARVTDKLCTISLTGNRELKIFISISALKGMLPEKDFLEISRSCLISLQHIRTIEGSEVIMNNGVRLSYSTRRKTTVLHAFQDHLAQQASLHASYAWKMDLAAEFRCFDICPIAFFIVENISNLLTNSADFVFRYANEAFALQQRQPLNHLINCTFSSKFPAAGNRWIPIFLRVALHGGTFSQLDSLEPMPDKLNITCYQPHYGFCACLLIPPPSQNPETRF